jgi:DNA-binding NarL/FixJ family response regulator
MNQSSVQILLVDDHPIVRRGLIDLIEHESDLSVCGEAENALDALDAVQKKQPDLAIIDITLKNSDGLDLVKRLSDSENPPTILVVSMHDEGLYAERALRAGAMGYVMKEEVDEKIVSAIRSVLQGKVYLSDVMRDEILRRFARTPRTSQRTLVEELSDRELEVFQLIGEGLETREIAERLCLSVKTIDSYRSRIKMKLNIRTATELIQQAVQWKLGQG